MKRIVIPTRDPGDWAPLLAKPERHWKKGYSAMALAACWESALPKLPHEVTSALNASGDPRLHELSIVLACPEFTTPLPGGSTSSQTDLMVVARNDNHLAVLGIEGKVEETFGPILALKRKEASSGVNERLEYLHTRLGLSKPLPDGIRYQLLHRTVAVLDFAREVHAGAAVMLVHSFSRDGTWYQDFAAFAQALGASPGKDTAFTLPMAGSPQLFLAWVSGDCSFTELDMPSGRSEIPRNYGHRETE